MKIKWMIGAVILTITALTNSQANAQQQQKQPEAHAFSIRQAIDYAHAHNVQVKNSLLDYQLQVQTNRSVTAGALPHISGSGNLTDYIDIPTNLLPAEFFGGAAGTFIPVKFGTKYNATGSITLSQTLFDGQVFVGLQARKASLDYAHKATEVTEQMIKVNVYKIYYQLAASKTQMGILDANIARAEKLLHDATLMHDNGFTEQIDVDKNNVQLANLKTEKLKVQSIIDNGYLGLKYLMGMPMRDTLVLTDSITDNEIKANLPDTGYNYNDRKEYQYLQIVKNLNQYNIKRYRLSLLPTLTLNGVYSKMAQRTKFDFFNGGDWFTTSYLGLTLNVPIFDGFAKRSNIRTAQIQLQQTQNKIQDLELSIDTSVIASRRTFTVAIQTLDYQKKNMEVAERVYNQAKKKYEAGLGSTTDINMAEADLKTAQNNYIAAMYDAIIARIDYTNAIGRLE